MVVDSSVLIAILLAESDAEYYAQRLIDAEVRSVLSNLQW